MRSCLCEWTVGSVQCAVFVPCTVGCTADVYLHTVMYSTVHCTLTTPYLIYYTHLKYAFIHLYTGQCIIH